jgi:predicted patatin/cPLA2 family phospholipase
MTLESTGLVLEGGGLRGVFTSGVLHYLMEKEIWFPYVIGVSMGACNAASYVSRQTLRNRRVNIDFVDDQRYLSYKRLLLKGELFGMDFIFDKIPNEIVPFDYDTFKQSEQKNWLVNTDCRTGEALYFEKDQVGPDYMKVLQASSSLPFISKPVHYKEKILMDGGLSDSIPIRKAIEHGNRKNVVILTRPKGYRKSQSKAHNLAALRYPHYKGLQLALKNRWKNYNDTMDYIDQLEKECRILVIRPSEDLSISRAERNKDKLSAGYDYGYSCMEEEYQSMCDFLEDDN